MGITHFPHGLFATPNIGGSKLIDIWNSDNVYFVDSINGSADNSGKTPDDAVALPSTAVTSATSGGTIYIRPGTTGDSVQGYYLDNITIPLGKTGISLLGAGTDCSNPYMGVEIKSTVAGTLTPVVNVLGAACLIEGIRFSGGNTDPTSFIISNPYNGTTARGYGMTIRGCRFQSAPGHLIGSGSAVYMATAIMCKIEGCIFNDNLCSIAARASYAAINGLYIVNNIFEGYPLTGRDVDIFITGGGNSKGVNILNNHFSDGKPNHGIVSLFISIDAGVLAGLVDNNCFAYTGTNGDALLAGTIGSIPATVFCVHNYFESGTENYGIIAR